MNYDLQKVEQVIKNIQDDEEFKEFVYETNENILELKEELKTLGNKVDTLTDYLINRRNVLHEKRSEQILTQKERRYILHIYENKCNNCKKVLEKDDVTVDHIIPISKGGTKHPDNLQILCRRCNMIKRSQII